MPSKFKPIYRPQFLTAAEHELQKSPPGSLADALVLLSAYAAKWEQQLPNGLIADLWAQQQSGHPRKQLRDVTPPLMLVVGEKGRLARLRMEWIEGDGCSGVLYAHRDMVGCMDDEGKRGGIYTDATWDGALTAAFDQAGAHGFSIPKNADVRWRVELVNEAEAEKFESVLAAAADPWEPCDGLHGRSAGAAFLIGLVYLWLRAREGTAIEAETLLKVNKLLPLLVLPVLPERGPLQELGDAERTKLDVLKCHHVNLTLIIPKSCGKGFPKALPAEVVDDLVKIVRAQMVADNVLDKIPYSFGAGHYVGGPAGVEKLKELLCEKGVVVVHGEAAIGKSALVFEAVRQLVQKDEGAFPGGRLYVDLNGIVLICDPPWPNPWDSGKAEPALEDIPRPFNLCGTYRVRDLLWQSMLKDIVSDLGKVPCEDLPKLKAQARNLLAERSVLVVLEGADNVPDAAIGEFLEPLAVNNTHIVWLTRRTPDSSVPGLAGRPTYEVMELSLEDSRELLCIHAFELVNPDALDVVTRYALDDATCAALDSIADDAEGVPQFLLWAGRAIRHASNTQQIASAAQQIAKEIRDDRLKEITNPDQRDTNPRSFLESSLARIQSTADYPALNATARRLFAGLTAFHPAHGAPRDLWALAAGLDNAQTMQRREFEKASSELHTLRLVRFDHEKNAHPVRVIAGMLASELWREQPMEARSAVLGTLCQAATAALDVPLPPQWFRNASWVAERTAQAAHFGHWVSEMGTLESEVDSVTDSQARQAEPTVVLCRAWLDFLANHVEPRSLLDLKDTGWAAVCRHFEHLPESRRGIRTLLASAGSWDCLGRVRVARKDFTGAEAAFKAAMVVKEKLVVAQPGVADRQAELSVSWNYLGDLRLAQKDLAGAEAAFKAVLAVREKLVEVNPSVSRFQRMLAVSWERLGTVLKARNVLAGAEAAFNNAKATWEKQVEHYPSEPDCEHGLATSFLCLGDVRLGLVDWVGAETSFKDSIKLFKKLVVEHPDVPHYREGLATLWGKLGGVCQAREDLAGAEAALASAEAILKKLMEDYPKVPDYQSALSVSLGKLGDLRLTCQDLAGAELAVKSGLAISMKLADEYPSELDFQSKLANSWGLLGDVYKAQWDWRSAETAFKNAETIWEELVARCPDVPDYQTGLAVSGLSLGDAQVEGRDWTSARGTFSTAITVLKKLAAADPTFAPFQGMLAEAWRRYGMVCEAQQDWAGAKAAISTTIALLEKHAAEHPDVSDYQHDLVEMRQCLATVAKKTR